MYKTKVKKITQNLIRKNKVDVIKKSFAIKEAAEYILAGEVVAFPTETVYGLGANALKEEAVSKIFKAKGRPSDNPLIAHIASKKQLPELIEGEIPKAAEILIERFWPGPLTIIFKKSKKVPQITTAGLDTVAVRMPSHPVALALIEKVNLPLAAPSANSSGFPSPTQAQHVYNDLNGKIPLIVDGGICNIGVESTVIEIEGSDIHILRPGGTPKELIKEALGEKYLVETINQTEVKGPKSPGMKYKHYAPHTPLWIIQTNNIENVIQQKDINNKNTLLILTRETLKTLKQGAIQANIKDMGSVSNLEHIAKHLYNILREADKEEFDLVLIEEVPTKEIGEAVMNRLKKAAVKII